MICVVIKGPSIQEAEAQIKKALPYAALIELRLDLFQSLDIKTLRERYALPMIFKLKDKTHLSELLALKPEYVDLDVACAESLPGTQLIVSYHDFEKTPEDLEGIYRRMKKIPARFYKIAVQAKSTLDATRLLSFAKKDMIAISMGPLGQFTRLLAPIHYAALDEGDQTAPGQFLVETLSKHYRSKSKDLYGLIGDPVDQSISDQTHNGLIDGLYVKMRVTPEELPQFLKEAKQLNFCGLSVTMPLKERILPYLDALDPEAKQIGVVNTVVFKDGQSIGYNTDAKGALDALEVDVQGRHLVLIGAGGAAKAIGYEAIKRGGVVTYLRRNEPFPSTPYAIVINCTPADLPIDPELIPPGTVVMDIKTKPKNTPFLQKAKGCRIVYGYQMFIEQALGQFELWGQRIERLALTKKVLEALSNY